MSGPDRLRVHLVANLSGGARRETFKGREHLVVPVVMLRQTVVNGAYVAKDELKPEAWNGVPVTLNHPEARGQPITANSPQTIETWAVGTIFNSKVDGDKLKAEAWVDIETAEELAPGLVDRLEAGEPMDVSTGYFPKVAIQKGRYNGKAYTEVHTELKPDHLALLPEVAGACSWQDGCGVRANAQDGKMSQPDDNEKGLLKIFSRWLSGNARGSDDDRRQILSDLISDDRAPFLPDDMYSLMEMSEATLKALRDQYLGATPSTNVKGDTDVSDCKKQAPVLAANKVSDMSVEDFTALITNTASAAAKSAATEAVAEALTANKSADLVSKLVANKDLGLTEDELKAMPLSALEKLAANAAKAAEAPKVNRSGNYGGRGLVTQADDGQGTSRKYGGMANNAAAGDAGSNKKEDK